MALFIGFWIDPLSSELSIMVKEASEKEEIRVGKGDIPQGLIS